MKKSWRFPKADRVNICVQPSWCCLVASHGAIWSDSSTIHISGSQAQRHFFFVSLHRPETLIQFFFFLYNYRQSKSRSEIFPTTLLGSFVDRLRDWMLYFFHIFTEFYFNIHKCFILFPSEITNNVKLYIIHIWVVKVKWYW